VEDTAQCVRSGRDCAKKRAQAAPDGESHQACEHQKRMPTALITGASVGIGRELAKLCARDGYDVVLVARSHAVLQDLATEISESTGRTAWVVAKDLALASTPVEIFRQLADSNVTVDVLINNAGFGLLGRFWELDDRQQMQMIQVNIAALTHLTRLFLPGMIERRRGRILNVASTAAFQPGPLMSVYYATKAYVVSFSEAIHNECRDFGVTATALCPGPTRTEFDKRAGASESKLFGGRVMEASTVAQIGFRAMTQGKPLVIAGRMNAVMAFLTRFAPIQFAASMARRFQES
jgi:short-subunit dehydrogenase